MSILETSEDDLPTSSYVLIDLLNAQIPHRCILPREDERDAHRYAGMRELIDRLIEWKEESISASKILNPG